MQYYIDIKRLIMMDIHLERVKEIHSDDISKLVGELLHEIMQRIDIKAFNFDLEQTTKRLKEFIETEKNFVFVAKDNDNLIGFITIYESFALYSEGAFGTIAELYVKPHYRSKGIGKMLIEKAKEFGKNRNWTRLEVTTPPLPQFDNTLEFYSKEEFEISGGRKMKVLLKDF